MANQVKESVERVQNRLLELGYTNKVVELPDRTRTDQDAADAIGCEVAQIAKSVIFRSKNSDSPSIVVASGVNRVNEKSLSNQLNDKLMKADADFVRERTGFVIGGVPPLGNKETITTIIDEDLFQYNTIW
ncbi:YbaK/EbsC family protein, partial [Alicyclobacillus acidiphilus]